MTGRDEKLRRLLSYSLVLGDREAHRFGAIGITTLTEDVEQITLWGRKVEWSAFPHKLFDPLIDFAENGFVTRETFVPLRVHQCGFSVMS